MCWGVPWPIERAGCKRWPKLFQNLRSSCETDLTSRFPLHVVAEWLGNTPEVATKHYLQVTEIHFRQATELREGEVEER